MYNKNIVVIGGCGFIGSHLSNYLSKENKVLVLDNLLSGKVGYLDSRVNLKRFDIRYATIRLFKILKDFNTDYVFHLAACPFIPDSLEYPEEFIDINIKGTNNVLKACQEANVKRVLVYSSSEIYGGINKAISEEDLICPRSTYATTKLAADRLSYNFYKEHRIPVIILRQFNCYGPNWTQPYVIPEIIKQLETSKNLKLGNINASRDFLYIEDEVSMVSELLEKAKLGDVYNLGSGNTYTIKEIAYMLSEIIRHEEPEIIIQKKKLRPDDVQYLLSNNSKIYSVIKTRPKTFIKDGLRKTYLWFKEYYEKM